MEKTNAWFYRLGKAALFLTILAGGLFFLSLFFSNPGYDPWSGYVRQPRKSIELLFVGNSHAFCSIVPTEIWNKAQVTSWAIGAGSLNTISKVAFLEEALKTQQPSLVMLEVYGLGFRSDADPYNTAMIFRSLPQGRIRAQLFFATVPPARYGEFLLPILGTHSVWPDITSDRVWNLKPRHDDYLAGSYMFSGGGGLLKSHSSGLFQTVALRKQKRIIKTASENLHGRQNCVENETLN